MLFISKKTAGSN